MADVHKTGSRTDLSHPGPPLQGPAHGMDCHALLSALDVSSRNLAKLRPVFLPKKMMGKLRRLLSCTVLGKLCPPSTDAACASR